MTTFPSILKAEVEEAVRSLNIIKSSLVNHGSTELIDHGRWATTSVMTALLQKILEEKK
ncbi:hypothetical protein DPMN_078336 [Dreissena polymorpha]|uniref:Uncharacterized protein n=1 Tax=Dreissena polymorpha TaxID=45954 RepID=A0A9D3YM27_DREPO|nr:hypothetical protein DPMN_078336 [Dreissena polymorpha]